MAYASAAVLLVLNLDTRQRTANSNSMCYIFILILCTCALSMSFTLSVHNNDDDLRFVIRDRDGCCREDGRKSMINGSGQQCDVYFYTMCISVYMHYARAVENRNN
jgi:hypothetical protein